MDLNQLTEKDFKIYLIEKLNRINNGWIDGDKNNIMNKTVDLVNEPLKFAIEIKDDKTYRHEFPPLSGEMITNELNLNNKSEQLKNHARDANKKFKNYLNYKTILLIRTDWKPERKFR